MMRKQGLITILVMITSLISNASFHSLSTIEQVAAADVIAVLTVIKEHEVDKEFVEARVVSGVLGVNENEIITIWRETRVDTDGKEREILGRNAYLQKGKSYLIFLKKNRNDRLVTVSSSHDSYLLEDGKLGGHEPIENKIDAIERLVQLKEVAEKNLQKK